MRYDSSFWSKSQKNTALKSLATSNQCSAEYQQFWGSDKKARLSRMSRKKRQEAGCFVLLTNVPRQGDMAETGAELLQAYKEQHGIERNFSFLKDPLIVNDIFLKKPERIEVLGAILLMALMVWNLIEHCLRQHIK